jgi:TonB family protein
MKICPKCGQQYPETEGFCETDGTALIEAEGSLRGRLTTVMDEADTERSLECPVCGGKSLPGEIRCNYCGARLRVEDGETEQPTPQFQEGAPGSLGSINNAPGPREFGEEPVYGAEAEPPKKGRRVVAILGFTSAAVVALAAGAWFALYLGQSHPSSPPAAISSPVISTPIVDLARSSSLRIQSDVIGAPARDPNSLLKVFADNKAGLANVYSNALGSDPSMRDGMVVRLHILPDGAVDNGAVAVSTSGNPSFDAEVVEAMTSWKFGSTDGPGMTTDYPIVFAPSPSAVGAVESDLSAKIANLSPSEPPEYAFSPSGAPPVAAAETSPSGMPSPIAAASPSGRSGSSVAVGSPSASEPTTLAAVPPAESMATPNVMPEEIRPARPRLRRHRRARPEMAALPPPKPPLIERVNDELRADRRLRRVQAYTNGSTVTIFGKVFDDDDRLLAERSVRNIGGVSGVINNLTTDTAQWQQNQNLITQALQSAGLNGVQVKVIGRSAYLSGQVKSNIDRARAVTVAQSAAPVKVRENLITVAIGNVLGF